MGTNVWGCPQGNGYFASILNYQRSAYGYCSPMAPQGRYHKGFQDRDKKRKILYMQVATALQCPIAGCNMQRQNIAELKRKDGDYQFSFDAHGKKGRTTRL